jgi:hypothetical protein
MTRKSGFRTWPPLWTTTGLDPNDKPTGEIGTLEKVLMNELFDNKIFLFVQYQGFRYMGSLHFDDPGFCCAIFTLLNSSIGRPIKEIGDTDVSHTL